MQRLLERRHRALCVVPFELQSPTERPALNTVSKALRGRINGLLRRWIQKGTFK